jgi:hypothetical protein
LAQKNNNFDFSGEFDEFLRFLTSYSPSITTPNVKKEYKLEPWGGGKIEQGNESLCWDFQFSHASPLFPLHMRLSLTYGNPFFQNLCSPYLARKKPLVFLGLV